jgi:hypothetical protein
MREKKTGNRIAALGSCKEIKKNEELKPRFKPNLVASVEYNRKKKNGKVNLTFNQSAQPDL